MKEITATDRLKQIASQFRKGARGRTGSKPICEVPAEDIVDCCKTVKSPSQIVRDLLAGSEAAGVNARVLIQVDDLYHLVECAENGRSV